MTKSRTEPRRVGDVVDEVRARGDELLERGRRAGRRETRGARGRGRRRRRGRGRRVEHALGAERSGAPAGVAARASSSSLQAPRSGHGRKRARFTSVALRGPVTIATPEGVDVSLTLAGAGVALRRGARRPRRSSSLCWSRSRPSSASSAGSAASATAACGDRHASSSSRLRHLLRGARAPAGRRASAERPARRPLRRRAGRLPHERDPQHDPARSTSCRSPTWSERSRSSRQARTSGSATSPRARSSCATGRRDRRCRHPRGARPRPAVVGAGTRARSRPRSSPRCGSFLERRHEIEPGARAELARTFATRLRPKVAGAPDGLDAERFLSCSSLRRRHADRRRVRIRALTSCGSRKGFS